MNLHLIDSGKTKTYLSTGYFGSEGENVRHFSDHLVPEDLDCFTVVDQFVCLTS